MELRTGQLYQTAAQLYASSLRAFEQRSMAFLIMQSVLVGAFAVLLSGGFSPDVRVIPALGISIVGIATSLLFYVLHQTTSQDVAYWRAYMRLLESGWRTEHDFQLLEQPWYLLYKVVDSRSRLQRRTLKSLPGPILWLALPGVFLVAWISALLWIAFLYGQPLTLHKSWLIVGIPAVIIGTASIIRWMKAIDSSYRELQGITEEKGIRIPKYKIWDKLIQIAKDRFLEKTPDKPIVFALYGEEHDHLRIIEYREVLTVKVTGDYPSGQYNYIYPGIRKQGFYPAKGTGKWFSGTLVIGDGIELDDDDKRWMIRDQMDFRIKVDKDTKGKLTWKAYSMSFSSVPLIIQEVSN